MDIKIMAFESVYRVSSRNSVPTDAEVDLLSRELSMELPLGYREYVTAFGPGTMCDFLVVKMPNDIRNPDSQKVDYDRVLLDYAAECLSQQKDQFGLTPADIQHATIFAYASSERPFWFATRTQGMRLFEHVEGDSFEIPNGFYGLVEHCTTGQHHTFPFFEPRNGRRRMRTFAVRPGIGGGGFVDAMAQHWGRESLRCSRNSIDELYPHYFVPAIEGHIELHLDPNYSRLPSGCFFVRARYDIASEAVLTAFVEALLLPGGGPYDYIGESW
jgi:hypothetical protein